VDRAEQALGAVSANPESHDPASTQSGPQAVYFLTGAPTGDHDELALIEATPWRRCSGLTTRVSSRAVSPSVRLAPPGAGRAGITRIRYAVLSAIRQIAAVEVLDTRRSATAQYGECHDQPRDSRAATLLSGVSAAAHLSPDRVQRAESEGTMGLLCLPDVWRLRIPAPYPDTPFDGRGAVPLRIVGTSPGCSRWRVLEYRDHLPCRVRFDRSSWLHL
jgi:hypothetical protein